MSAIPSTVLNGVQRRLVLVDFDWQDADIMPELLQQPGVSVRLVAGERPDNAGVRLAEVCGLPRTVDLADLTREIFDLALVSERSPRRTQIEGLLLALGTPSVSPQSFLTGDGTTADTIPAVEAPLELHAAAFETTLGGDAFDAIVDQAIPDWSPEAPTEPQLVTPRGDGRLPVQNLDDFPTPEDRRTLEAALRDLVNGTGAERAELHVGDRDGIELVVEVGPKDPLLQGLVTLALQLGTPQVVSCVAGSQPGMAWGAWPFGTSQRRGVIAASGLDPSTGFGVWERTVDDLRTTWNQHEREMAAPAFPLVPEPNTGWLDPEQFSVQLELALERNRRDRLRFSLHRLTFTGSLEAIDALCRELPSQLRDTDSMARPTPTTVVLLTAGARDAFAHVRRRLLAIWERAWHDTQNAPPAPALKDERIEMNSPADGEVFLATAGIWLSG